MTRAQIGMAALAVWAPATLVAVAFLMVDHIAPLPPPGDPHTLLEGLDAHLPPGSKRAVHVIYEHCTCTDRLFEHLLERGPTPEWAEAIVYVGTSQQRVRRSRSRGFQVVPLSRDALRLELALDAAPVLVIVDEAGRLAYLGGYFPTPAAVRPQDARFLEEVRRGGKPAELPVFGCAVDEALAQQRDPLGFRRWK